MKEISQKRSKERDLVSAATHFLTFDLRKVICFHLCQVGERLSQCIFDSLFAPIALKLEVTRYNWMSVIKEGDIGATSPLRQGTAETKAD